MDTIVAGLLDAEEQEWRQVQRSHLERDWLEKLRDAVYQADDLFDEVASIAQRKKLMEGNKVRKEVRLFFSRFNQLAFAFNTSREIKNIKERLSRIAKDHHNFGLRSHFGSGGRMAEIRTREESHSWVHVDDVIGRDEDKKAVIDMLLDSSIEEDVYFVTIVGIGGLGKTALAQLVYNDERIKREFSLKLWVCVSEEFDLQPLLCKLLGSNKKNIPLEQLQRQFRDKIDGKRYLLVLDDVWNDDRNKWVKLRDLLIRGGKGSRVVITTRSKLVARSVGVGSTYELKGLSPENSWRLFERFAFKKGQERTDVELVEMGKHIVKKCANVPLAIRVVGGLLYGQEKRKWISFRDLDLGGMKQDDSNGIMPVLKLSYYHLQPSLKRCFSFCGLFPKDYLIEKVMLVTLWIAHGFIKPLEGQSIEDAGEEYFMALVQRCFFQDVEQDDLGNMSCKLHDLMHDVAQEVAKTEILVVNSNRRQFNNNIRHLSVDIGEVNNIPCSLANEIKKLRTFFLLGYQPLEPRQSTRIHEVLLSTARCLRVLDLHDLGIKSLPNTIDNLVHLRYLDLSNNYDLQLLPSSLSRLNNLQTLKLLNCAILKELPRDLTQLVNLRHLDISSCDRLTYMPPGMNHMTCLQRLTMFVVGGASQGSTSKRARVGDLEDLAALTNLRGDLQIKVLNFEAARVREVGYVLRGKEHLKGICITWGDGEDPYEWDDDADADADGAAALMEGLQPHPNVRGFGLEGYPGVSLPKWASMEHFGTSLPNLVYLYIKGCSRLQQLPLISQLPHLKVLQIEELENLEYIDMISESYSAGISHVAVYDQSSSFFPSLERLELEDLPKLKGWWRSSSSSSSEVMEHGSHAQPQLLILPSFSTFFPRLSVLSISDCPNLTSIPLSPNMETLSLTGFNENHFFSSSLSREDPSWKLKSVDIDMGFLKYLPFESFHSLSELSISRSPCHSLSILGEVFHNSRLSCSLRSLHIHICPQLKSLREGGLEHLTALERLVLSNLDELEEFEDGNLMPWKSLHHNLRYLEFRDLPQLVNLPQGLRFLTSLQSFHISFCNGLEALPEWISCLKSLDSLEFLFCHGLKSLPEAMRSLTSLSRLEIWKCACLSDRCRKPNGEDWPKIRHIPNVSVVPHDV